MELKKTRLNMIQNAFIPNGIVDETLLSAFLKVEREYFAPAHLKDNAFVYEDSIDLGDNRFLSNAKIYAKLLQEAKIKATDKVAILPLSCGYYAAILTLLAEEVWGIDFSKNHVFSDLPLKTATYSKEKLKVFRHDNSLEIALKENAPYDFIFIDGSVEKFPDWIWDNVTENGRISYVDSSNPGYFYGRVVYKNNPDSLKNIITEIPVPPLDDFRRPDDFKL